MAGSAAKNTFPSIVDTFAASNRVEEKPLKKSGAIKLGGFDYLNVEEEKSEGLEKSILKVLNRPGEVERLAFTVDPSINNKYAGIYKSKRQLIPDAILKRIAIQDDLVASIVNARANQVAAFGRPRIERSSTGYVIEPLPGVVEKLSPEQKQELDQRIERAVKTLETCGEQNDIPRNERCTFATWLAVSTKNAVTVGRLACELIWGTDLFSGERKFSRFRAIDAGTILQAVPAKDQAAAVRREAVRMLEQIRKKKLKDETLPGEEEPEVAWVQVIDGTPRQVFADDQCVVHNFYPVVDIELDGYPVTPIDTMMSAVTTHINITSHNKLYFQSGRATRGMLVIKSDDVDENVVGRIKQQFNASINSVNNSWRMPVFAVGAQDDVSWSPIDNSSRDMEFQYLTDMNARVILSAFQMSPEELPGWSYLSKGTNNQALSESNNEYRLEAARDLGIRPLLSQFEDFINGVLFPLIDPVLAKITRVRLLGLDAETAEKESVRIQQDMPIHMTYDQVLERVEKKVIGPAMGGTFPLNPQYQAVLDKYFTVGQILEFFCGVKGASKDPALAYFRDPFWFQFQQLQDARKQMAMQAQQAQAQAQQQAAGPGGPGDAQTAPEGVDDTAQPANDNGGAGGGGEGSKTPHPTSGPDGTAPTGEDLTRSIDQAIALLTKGETDLPESKRRLLIQHKLAVKQGLDGIGQDIDAALKAILGTAAKHVAKKN